MLDPERGPRRRVLDELHPARTGHPLAGPGGVELIQDAVNSPPDLLAAAPAPGSGSEPGGGGQILSPSDYEKMTKDTGGFSSDG